MIDSSRSLESYINKAEISLLVNIDDKNCWNWKFGLFSAGYGVVAIDNKAKRVHRVVYERFMGEIPSHLYVLHKCDNVKCINPEHLFLGTQTDNMRDMVQKRRNPKTYVRMPKLYCKRGHERTSNNLRSNGTCIACTKWYDAHRGPRV